MAVGKRITTGLKIASAQQVQAEAKQAFQRDNDQRTRSMTLLRPDDVAGEYDAGRLLVTTLGGVARPLTADDLAVFRQNIRNLKAKFKGGIKPKDVINLSLSSDRERAHKEIRHAVPISTKGGEVQFMTNSGPNSNVDRHRVIIRLLNFEAAVVSPKPPEKIVSDVVNGPIQMSCSCQRWRYWYAYMSTAGNYNSNPAHREGAFPKIRNPKLVGVACKHILRVVTSLTQSPAVKGYVGKLIQKERDVVESKRKRNTKADMEKLAEQMAKENWRQRAVRTSDEKRQKQSAVATAEAKLVKDAKAKAAAMQRAAKTAQKAVEVNLKKLLTMGAINQAKYESMLAELRNSQ